MKVLVTGATWSAGLAVIRGLAKAGWEVVGADTRRLRWNAHSRYTKPYRLLPDTEPEFVEALTDLLEREKPDVLLPVNQTEWIVNHQHRLAQSTALLVPPDESFRIANDHQAALEACRELGIPAPRTLMPEEAHRMIREGTAVVVKPRDNAGSACGVSFVTDPFRLMPLKKKTEARFGKTFLQEFIPGEEPMKTVNLLFDQETELLASFTTDKLRQWPTTGGLSVLSVSTSDRHLIDQVLPLFKKWKWRGPAEVELKIDARDGRVNVIEINPRFWSYIGFPVRCGVHFPLLTCQAATGQNRNAGKCPSYAVGMKYLHPACYLKLMKEEFLYGQNRRRCLRQIVADLRGRKVANNADWTDSLVILAKLFTTLKKNHPGC